MSKTVTEIQKELADREAIRDCLFRYCRGIDRIDVDLLYDVYWPGAIDDHLLFKGPAEGFIEFTVPLLQEMEQTMHKLGNILIQIQGEATAGVETYFDAYHKLKEENGRRRDQVVGGRYLDRFEKRNDRWKIADRLVVLDWFRLYDDSGDWASQPLGMQVMPGGRKPDDRSYGYLRG